jgi:hypothetical protein
MEYVPVMDVSGELYRNRKVTLCIALSLDAKNGECKDEVSGGRKSLPER